MRELEDLLQRLGITDPKMEMTDEESEVFNQRAMQLLEELDPDQDTLMRLKEQAKEAAGITDETEADLEFMQRCMAQIDTDAFKHPGEALRVSEQALLAFLNWAYNDAVKAGTAHESDTKIDFMSFAMGMTAGLCCGQEMTVQRHA